MRLATGAININSQGRYAHIDALRAVSVLLVVLNHAGLGFVPGTLGVTIFFTISGFVITTLVLKERARTGRFNVRRFYFNRAAKLMPPLVLAVIVPTMVWALFHPISWWAFASQVFFVFNWVQVVDPATAVMTLPGTSVVWSLGVEEQFYIGFAALWLLLVSRRHALSWLAALCAATIVYSVVARSFVDPESFRFVRATDTRLDSIAWGVLAAVLFSLYQDGHFSRLAALGKDWVPFAAAALIAASNVLPASVDFLGFTLQSIAAATLIVYGMMPAPSRIRSAMYWVSAWKPVAVIGLASYSIYLAHFPTILLVQSWGLPSAITVAAGIGAGLVVGVLMWRWAELPALAWKTGFLNAKTARSDVKVSERAV